MKTLITVLIFGSVLTACGGNHVEFSGIKVLDDRFNVALDTTDKHQVDALETLFNNRVEDNYLAPEFKYLIEVKTSKGAERWKYSIDGHLQIHKQGNHPIYALIDKNKFNQLAQIQ